MKRLGLALAVALLAGACGEQVAPTATEPEAPSNPAAALLPPGADLSVLDQVGSSALPAPSLDVIAAVGAVLAQFAPPVTGNGRGLAFDGGTSLFYSLSGNPTGFEVASTGGPLINSFVNGTGRPIGALAWDPTGLGGSGSLWMGTYDFAPPAVIVELNPTTGAVLTTITAVPGNGPFPNHIDGLAYDPATNSLFYSTDLGPSVFQISATGGPAALITSFPISGGDLSGHAFDGFNLYSSQPADGFSGSPNPFPPPQVYVTDLSGAISANFSTSPLQGEDLAFDGVTFAPLCAVWVNNAGSNVLTAFEVDCPNQPPECSAAAPSVDALWPPNHKFVPINVVGVTDPDGDPITINIDAIWQDEPTDTYGDGRFTPDGQGVGTSTAEVRAERTGTPAVPGNGRVYHISFTATDPFGASCSSEVLVGVPHDQNGDPAVDDGALFDSTI